MVGEGKTEKPWARTQKGGRTSSCLRRFHTAWRTYPSHSSEDFPGDSAPCMCAPVAMVSSFLYSHHTALRRKAKSETVAAWFGQTEKKFTFPYEFLFSIFFKIQGSGLAHPEKIKDLMFLKLNIFILALFFK